MHNREQYADLVEKMFTYHNSMAIAHRNQLRLLVEILNVIGSIPMPENVAIAFEKQATAAYDCSINKLPVPCFSPLALYRNEVLFELSSWLKAA